MTLPIIKLPCTAQELESALHAVCDHDGLWECEVRYDYYEKSVVVEVKMNGETGGASHRSRNGEPKAGAQA